MNYLYNISTININMRIGVIDMYKNKMYSYLPIILTDMGYSVTVVNYKEDWLDIIRKSRIKNWFLTGSEYDVMSVTAPQVDLEILKLNNKRFFLICYSMESVLLQLGCRGIKRKKAIREFFNLTMDGEQINAYRNHHTYIVPDSIKHDMQLLAKYQGNVMTVKYKNMMMTQWHPERTNDGIDFIRKWITN
jgi:GMP synthase-like glutamine amidotransferase